MPASEEADRLFSQWKTHSWITLLACLQCTTLPHRVGDVTHLDDHCLLPLTEWSALHARAELVVPAASQMRVGAGDGGRADGKVGEEG